jgi:hypothetical protein
MNESENPEECISEAHLQYMKLYVEKEEERSKATLERFLALKSSHRNRCRVDITH